MEGVVYQIRKQATGAVFIGLGNLQALWVVQSVFEVVPPTTRSTLLSARYEKINKSPS